LQRQRATMYGQKHTQQPEEAKRRHHPIMATPLSNNTTPVGLI